MELSRKNSYLRDHEIQSIRQVIVFEYLEMQENIRKRNKSFIYGESGYSETVWTSGTSERNSCPGQCPKLPAGWLVTEAERSKKPENHSLCTFGPEKQYNCDLSASYNIGARYFIREFLNLAGTERSSPRQKYLQWSVEPCVYADLRKLYA